MFFVNTFQNFASCEVIISLSLLSLIFLSPLKFIFEIFVFSPFSISKYRLTLFFGKVSTFDFIQRRARDKSLIKIHSLASLTKNIEGKLVEINAKIK